MDTDYTAVIQEFHHMWDHFPGMARLINKQHIVLASNAAAQEKGFIPDAVCAKVGAAEIHRQCKMGKMFKTGLPQADRVIPDRIRGWIPLEDYPELMVHFTILIPEEE